jgi:hypothetical protein
MYRSNKSFYLSRVLPVSIALLFMFWSAPPTHAQTGCLPVNGLSFERVSGTQLLAMRDGRNIAFVKLHYLSNLPSKLGAFRFFSPNLCISGAENRFTIDGVLYTVESIQMFKQ